MGLQQKASLYSGVGLLFLVAILASVGVWVVRDATDRSLNERVAVAQMVSRRVDQSLWAAQNELTTLAAMVDLQDGDIEPERQALASLFMFSGTLSHVFLTDADGRIVAAQAPETTLDLQGMADTDKGLAEALTASRAVITSVFMPLPERLPMFSVSVPVLGGSGEVVGAITGYLDLRGIIGSFIEPLGLGGTAYMEILNEDGQVMAVSGDQAGSSQEAAYAAHFASLIDGGEATLGECFGCHADGEGEVARTRQILAFAPLRAVTGGVAIRQTESETLAPTRRLLRYMLLAGSPLLVLGLVFTWMSTRMVVRPVVELTAASRRIAAGDLEVPITTSRHDELGQLAETFDRMRIGLRDSLTQMESRATESEQRARHLAALNAVAATASQSLDLHQILADSLEQVLAFLPMRAGCIYLAQDGVRQSRPEVSLNMTDELTRAVPVTAGGMDGATDIVFYDRVAGSESSTFVGVPLVSKAQNLGEMWLAGPERQHLTAEETALLTSIGRQLGVAIHNALLFQDAGRRESEAQALRQLGLEVSRFLEPDRILTTVVDSTVQLLKAEGAVVALHDDVSRQVYTAAVSGALPSGFRSLRLDPTEDSLIGRTIRIGSPQSSTDYLHDDGIAHGPTLDGLLRRADLHACLAVPINVGDRVGGVLMAMFRRKPDFQPKETELLQQLGNQAAVALENARLRDQVQELAIVEERTRLSREMHDSLGQVLAYVGLEADEITRLLTSGEADEATAKVAEVRKAVREAYEEVRHAILALRTPLSPGIELPKMLQQYLESFRSQTGIDVSVNVRDEAAVRFASRTALQLVRVVQEALSNVRKHAASERTGLTFEVRGRQAVLTISDDGIGFDVSKVYTGGQHFGIQVMTERMVALGGSLEITSAAGKGTRVVAKLPLEGNLGK